MREVATVRTRSLLHRSLLAAAALCACGNESTAYADDLEKEIARRRAELSQRSSDLAKAVEDTLIADRDARIFINERLLEKATAAIRRLPLDYRTIIYKTTRTEGYVVEEDSGLLGCGYFVELSNNSLTAQAPLDAITLRADSAGNLNLRFAVKFAASGAFKFFVRGPICRGGHGCNVRVEMDTERPIAAALPLQLQDIGNGSVSYTVTNERDREIPYVVSYETHSCITPGDSFSDSIRDEFVWDAGELGSGKFDLILHDKSIAYVGQNPVPYSLAVAGREVKVFSEGIEIYLDLGFGLRGLLATPERHD